MIRSSFIVQTSANLKFDVPTSHSFPWIQVRWLLVAMVTVTVVMLAFLCLNEVGNAEGVKPTNSDEFDQKLLDVIQTLGKAQTKSDAIHHQLLTEATETVRRLCPWMLDLEAAPTQSSANFRDPAPIVFLHTHLSLPIHRCIHSTLTDLQVTGPFMTSAVRNTWHEANHSFKSRITMHAGQYATGLCKDFSRSRCSMAAIFRDPFERGIASHEYCKSATADEMCRVANAKELSLRQWFLHHGSLFLQQLTFNPEVCNWTAIAPNASHQASLRSVEIPLLLSQKQLPCWYKHKLWLDNLAQEERDKIVLYIISNMDKWFSVVALHEKHSDSLEMIERVYKLPQKHCDIQAQQPLDNNSKNSANRKKRELNLHYDSDPDYIRYDSQVKSALDADLKIYSKAVEIFKHQKRLHSNVIASL